MKTAAIIAEYNPFHNGHAYHIKETKDKTGADYVIAVMSGDFVQRGAPAFLDKYERTFAALASGCDLVLELPVIYSTGSAEYFSSGAITLLNQLGVCDFLSFGSEEGSLQDLLPLSDILTREPEEYQASLRDYLKNGFSFPAAREKALSSYLLSQGIINRTEDLPSFLKGSNNILGLEYLKALKRTNSTLTPFTIMRKGSGYHDTELHESLSSASAIRKHAATKNEIQSLSASLPPESFSSITSIKDHYTGFPDYDCLTPYLHQILLLEQNLSKYLDWDAEMANRLRQLPWPGLSFTATADGLKSRNLTHSRIHRALLHLILGITKDKFTEQYSRNPVPYARILGFRKESSALLRSIKNQSSTPLITKPSHILKMISKEDSWVWEKDLAASQLYQSIQFHHFGHILPAAYERSPVIVDSR